MDIFIHSYQPEHRRGGATLGFPLLTARIKWLPFNSLSINLVLREKYRSNISPTWASLMTLVISTIPITPEIYFWGKWSEIWRRATSIINGYPPQSLGSSRNSSLTYDRPHVPVFILKAVRTGYNSNKFLQASVQSFLTVSGAWLSLCRLGRSLIHGEIFIAQLILFSVITDSIFLNGWSCIFSRLDSESLLLAGKGSSDTSSSGPWIPRPWLWTIIQPDSDPFGYETTT